MLSAIAITSSDPTMLSLGLELWLSPMMNARQVIIAELAPKLYFVRCDIRKGNHHDP